jgi:hypothetical protein
MLASVEKRSSKRRVDGDASLFAIEYLPSFNCLQYLDLQTSQRHSWQANRQAGSQTSTRLCLFFRPLYRPLDFRVDPQAVAGPVVQSPY